MAVDKTGAHWRGEDFEDLAEFVRAFKAGGYKVAHVEESVCASCSGRGFAVLVDDEQGCAQRVCLACGTAAFIADSADSAEASVLAECRCPCGGETFASALGIAMTQDGQDVRWVSVGLRCLSDGVLGVYTDWKIDYGPSTHLLHQA